MYRTVFWTLWEREGGWFGRMALKHVWYHIRNESPVQDQWRIQEAWGWCTGMTQRNGMGREVGGGFRMENTCTPMVDACWWVAKPVQYCKVKKIIIIIKIIIKNYRSNENCDSAHLIQGTKDSAFLTRSYIFLMLQILVWVARTWFCY